MRLRLLFALTFAGSGLAPCLAHAQTLTVADRYTWSVERDNREINEINRADCLANAAVTFSTQANGDAAFEVWAGTGCTDKVNRNENSQCVPVAKPDIGADSVSVRVQDILQATGNASLGPDTGTEAVCDVPSNMFGGIERHLFFMLRNVGTDEVVPGAVVDKPFLYDITSPPPPTNVKAGPGETSLEVSFDGPDASDLQRYRFYCSEIGTAPVDGEGGAGNTDDGPQSDDPTCMSSVLVPGAAPPESGYGCGEEGSAQATDGTTSTLLNGTRYAVAVAAEDAYGNVGELSSLACGTPQEVTGFFEAYRAAGGKGGGGFCSFGPAKRGMAPLALALLIGAVALLRRRK